MKNFLFFTLVVGMSLIFVNVSHASEKGSPKHAIEKQDASSVVGDALHAIGIVTSVIPGQVPLPNTPFVIGAAPETPAASIMHPPVNSAVTQIILYHLRC